MLSPFSKNLRLILISLMLVLFAALGWVLFAAFVLGDTDGLLRTSIGVLAVMSVIAGVVFLLIMRALVQKDRAIAGSTRTVTQANERLQATINASLDAVIVADMDGLILDFNGSAEKVFGYPRAEVMGLNLSEIIIPPHLRTAHKAGLKRFRDTRDPKLIGGSPVAISAIRKDGSEFPVELLLAKAEDKDGTVIISDGSYQQVHNSVSIGIPDRSYRASELIVLL